MPKIVSERIAKVRTTGINSRYVTLSEELIDMNLEPSDGVVITLLDDKTIVIKPAFRQKDILKNANVLNETHNTNKIKEESPETDTNFP